MKQKSRFKFLPWPGFEPHTSESNGRERHHSTTNNGGRHTRRDKSCEQWPPNECTIRLLMVQRHSQNKCLGVAWISEIFYLCLVHFYAFFGFYNRTGLMVSFNTNT